MYQYHLLPSRSTRKYLQSILIPHRKWPKAKSQTIMRECYGSEASLPHKGNGVVDHRRLNLSGLEFQVEHVYAFWPGSIGSTSEGLIRRTETSSWYKLEPVLGVAHTCSMNEKFMIVYNQQPPPGSAWGIWNALKQTSCWTNPCHINSSKPQDLTTDEDVIARTASLSVPRPHQNVSALN